VHKLVYKYEFLKPLANLAVGLLIFFTNRLYLKVAYQKMNNIMKDWAQNNLEQNQILLCGHSHLQELDVKNQFIDLGGNTNGLRQYGIIQNNTLTLYSDGKPKLSHKF
jgi:hypothetical protein